MTSRSTFRDKAGAVCYQKQLRDRYAHEPPPPVPHLSVRRAVVRPVSRKLAAQIILKYEWLGTMASTSKHFGIFFGPYCAGVTCVAVGGSGTAGPYVHRQYGVERRELYTLARGACVHWAPKGTNSRLVAWTCRLLDRGKVIVAYSDSDAGEIGTIYQACNWYYVGVTKSVVRGDMQYISPSGRIMNRIFLREVASKNRINTEAARKELLAAGWQKQTANPKGKWVYLLDKKDDALRRRIEAMAQPYPKRPAPDAEASRHPATNGAEGGASPTPALHLIT